MTVTRKLTTTHGIRAVSPALERYTTEVLPGMWNRPQLPARDRSIAFRSKSDIGYRDVSPFQ
jgi:hypothetical protein